MLDRWLLRLGISDRSRRVLSEAALDWQHEVATERCFAPALSNHARASIGFLRAAAWVVVDETHGASSPSWILRWVVCVLLCAAATWNGKVVSIAGLTYQWERHQLLVIQTLIGALMIATPLSILFGARRAASPVVGLSVVAGVTWCVLAWGLVPMAWQQYVDVAIGRDLPASYGPRYTMAMWVAQLLLTVLMSLVADRLRTSDRRASDLLLAGRWITGWLCLQVAVSFVIRPLAPASVVLRSLSSLLVILTIPVGLAGLWMAIVRRQESRREVVQ